jgi:hypothetical protein
MKPQSSFKESVERIWSTIGFTATGKAFSRRHADLATLMEVERGFGRQHFIGVGFWLRSLGERLPDRISRAHLCCRLERLFPEFREIILTAGAIGEIEQPQMHEKLLDLLRGPIDRSLASLESLDGLRAALTAGRFNQCLVTKEVRKYLLG